MRSTPAARLGALTWMLLGAAGAAQTTVLEEDFQSGSFPPAGWATTATPPNAGWNRDARHLNATHAFHDDFSGTNDARLITPSLDFRALPRRAYLHYLQYVDFAFARGRHSVEVTTDNGQTFVRVHEDQAPDGRDTVTVDLSAFAGERRVRIAFRYQGDFATEWSLDDVVVSDAPATWPPPAAFWPVKLPTDFLPVDGLVEDFDSAAGTVPSHMAITAVDAASHSADPEAFCNIGQLGPCVGGVSGNLPFSGAFCLEMGLEPTSTNFHQVRNALVVGYDGGGAKRAMIDFRVVSFDEEDNEFDGVWVSRNGRGWYRVHPGWLFHPPWWEAVEGVEIGNTPVDVSGRFYLLFGQHDNMPLGGLDGVQIDDIVVTGLSTKLLLSVRNLLAGQVAQLEVVGASTSRRVYFAYSLAGGGPTPTPLGPLLLSEPYVVMPPVASDPQGRATVDAPLPPTSSGVPIWFQALDETTGVLSNGLAEVIG